MSVGVVKLALSLVKIQLTNLTYIDSSGVVAKIEIFLFVVAPKEAMEIRLLLLSIMFSFIICR